MADVFQAAPMKFGGGFKSDTGMLTSTGGISGILMQSINITYQRPVTKIFELGNYSAPAVPAGAPAGTAPVGEGTKVYYVEGRPQGSMTVARVLGFSASINAFYIQFGSVCKAGANTLTLTLNNLECLSTVTTGPGAVVNSKPVTLAMSFCVLTSVGVSVTVQNFVVNENCSMEFANMTYTGS
jgi:hypothetical protein